MKANTCKFFNGDFVNTHCEAGVCYRDVTTDPDDINGIAYRKPCVVWDEPLVGKVSGRVYELSDRQRADYDRRGTCEKFQFPTNEELEADEVATKARLKEVLESIEKGVVPEGVIVCGSSWGMGVTTFPPGDEYYEFDPSGSIYGFGMGGDPHDFEPDYESNSPEEIKAWEDAKAACQCGRDGLSATTSETTESSQPNKDINL